MTLVREQAGALPLRKEAKLLSLVVADEPTLNGPAGTLEKELKARVPGVKSVRLDTRSTPEEAKAAADAAKDADAVLLSLFVRARSGQGKFVIPDAAKSAIPALLASGKPVVAVAFGSPYLLRDFPDLPTYLCAWGSQDVVQAAAVKALFGESAIERSPAHHDPRAREAGGRHREGGCRPVKPAQMGRTIGVRGFGMRRRALVSGLLAALALGPPAARGEQLPIKAYSTADGLSSDRIHCILPDSRGFLWLGTEDGISLFDGYGFTNYSVAEGLPGAAVEALLESRDGAYWIGTNGSLARWDASRVGATVTRIALRPDGPAEDVQALLEDRTGALWAGTTRGLYRLEREGAAWKSSPVRLASGPNAGPDIVNAIVEDRAGFLWAATEAGLYRRSPSGEVERVQAAGIPPTGARSLVEDRRGSLWIGTHFQGLFESPVLRMPSRAARLRGTSRAPTGSPGTT